MIYWCIEYCFQIESHICKYNVRPNWHAYIRQNTQKLPFNQIVTNDFIKLIKTTQFSACKCESASENENNIYSSWSIDVIGTNPAAATHFCTCNFRNINKSTESPGNERERESNKRARERKREVHKRSKRFWKIELL